MRGNAERRSPWLSHMACALILALAANTASQARQGPAPAPTVQVRVATITTFAVPLAGQRVKVVDGVVSRIVSSRFFVLAGGSPDVSLGGPRTVAVVLESGKAMLSPGQRVVVTGIVRGSLAQQEEVGRRLIDPLTMEERAALERRPLVIVSSAKSLAQQ